MRCRLEAESVAACTKIWKALKDADQSSSSSSSRGMLQHRSQANRSGIINLDLGCMSIVWDHGTLDLLRNVYKEHSIMRLLQCLITAEEVMWWNPSPGASPSPVFLYFCCELLGWGNMSAKHRMWSGHEWVCHSAHGSKLPDQAWWQGLKSLL